MLVTIDLKVNTKVYSSVDPALRETGKYVLRSWKKFNGHQPLSHDANARKPNLTAATAGRRGGCDMCRIVGYLGGKPATRKGAADTESKA
jgi:hypothetical protein